MATYNYEEDRPLLRPPKIEGKSRHRNWPMVLLGTIWYGSFFGHEIVHVPGAARNTKTHPLIVMEVLQLRTRNI